MKNKNKKQEAPEGGLFFSKTYDFLERYLPLQVGRSRATVESYRDALSVFRRYVRDERGLGVRDMRFGDCTRDLVLSFLEHLRARGCAAGTCNQRLAAIRSYLWYAADRDVALQSVAISVSRIPRVKGPQRVKETLSEDALAAILSQPDPRGRNGVRDRAMLALFYDSMVRLSELLGLDVGDVYLDDEPRIFVTGKGNKERMVAITADAAAHLEVLIACKHGPDPDPSAPLFYTVHGGRKTRMSESNAQDIVKKHAAAARAECPGIPEHVHPHMFRRTRATDLLQQDVELELISSMMGHADINTTRTYAKPSLKKQRAEMEAANPPALGEVPVWVGNEDEMLRLCGLR